MAGKRKEFNVLLLGDVAVGKTALVHQFICAEYLEHYTHTFYDDYRIPAVVGSEVVDVHVYDTDDPTALLPITHAVIGVFSLTSKESFQRLRLFSSIFLDFQKCGGLEAITSPPLQHSKDLTLVLLIPPHTAPSGSESLSTLIVLDGAIVAMITKNFSHLIRKSDGDKISGGRFEGKPWSILRALRIVEMESVDNEEICVVAKESEWIAAVIASSSRTAHGSAYDSGRRIALMPGKKFWVPLISGQYTGTGPSELALLRTFLLSPQRPHVVFLEFEVMSKRAEQSQLGGQAPKVIVELCDKRLSLERNIEARGIFINEDGD
ncbi:hypothetical protein AYO20_10864 [Fonsecaea nubica]|uniref:Uncharacterized protein n=1 Tax=Fonsecaea nubica TaxID=856822 RepID=A0A178C313_9EURO|nr:hypothetical protein AYO20_10864 [Fonsecaea nubica]OAL23844.1 hypothetical protein AYO20_10864 [Fonsecaea nubica]